MHQRQLGKTGISTSVLGAGSSQFRHSPPKLCAEFLRQAVDLGINYYDTARSYVSGEEAIGELPPHVNNELVVATKTGARGGKICLEHLQKSLRTLQRDRIDVWMTHMLESEEEYELCTDLGGFCDIAVAAKQAGLVRGTGASFHAPTQVILRAIEEHAFDVVMFQFNLIGRETVFGSSIASHRDVLLEAARANGVGVVVMKVLAGGELRHGASRLEFVADNARGRDVVGGAVRYASLNPLISTAVVGMSGTLELVRNVEAVTGVDDSLLEQFNEWSKTIEQIDNGECTRCGLCLNTCPEGIEIPKVMRIFDQERFFGMDLVARHKYRLMPVNASACRGCLKCQEVCPEEFDIAALLGNAHAALWRAE